jgi:hypothetical protein
MPRAPRKRGGATLLDAVAHFEAARDLAFLKGYRALPPAIRNFLLVGLDALSRCDAWPPADAARVRAVLEGVAAGRMDIDLAGAYLRDLGFRARNDA